MQKLPTKCLDALIDAVNTANRENTSATLSRTLHASTREAIVRRELVTRTSEGLALSWDAVGIAEAEIERREHDANEAAANEQADADAVRQPGPFGVFEDGLCVEDVDTWGEGQELLVSYREGSQCDYQLRPLCLAHPDAQQPRGDCDDCEDVAPSPVGVLADSAVGEMYNHPIPGTAAPAVVGFATQVGTVNLGADGNTIDGVRYPATSEGFTAFADELDRRARTLDHPSDLVTTFIGHGRHSAGVYATAEGMGKARAEVLLSASATGRLDGHPASLRALVTRDLAAEVQENGRSVFYVTPLGTGVARARRQLNAARVTA